MAARRKLIAVVTAERGLNLRTGPHISYEPTAILDKGEELALLSLPNGAAVEGWNLVESKTHGIGWVMSRYVEAQE